MPKAIWGGVVLAETRHFEEVEGTIYFPPDSLNHKYFKENSEKTFCNWKGEASYYDITVNGEVNEGAAWVYLAPMEAAEKIKGYVAFWKGIEVETEGTS